MDFSTFNALLVLLVAALVVSASFCQWHLPAILGYLFVGILLGPYVFNLLRDQALIQDIAEFGVVFLLFTIGLEFSLSKLIAMRRTVLGFGGLQVLISVLVTYGVALLLGLSHGGAIVLGGVVAMSSTAIVLKQLTDQTELYLNHGYNAIGILLLQDLAVLPFLILVPKLGAAEQGFWVTLAIALIKGVLVTLTILTTGRLLLRPVFNRIASLRSNELFTLTTLVVALGAAGLTQQVGLSLSLGAFLAGMMLGETEYRHQIEIEIRPFRDVLLGLFFISIGMQFDLPALYDTWHWVALLLAALIGFKVILITGLGRLLGKPITESLRTGLVLAQGGEFGFAILILALMHQVLPLDYGQVVLGAILLSMMISPLLIRYNAQISRFLLPLLSHEHYDKILQSAQQSASHLNNHAILCGFGRMGQAIARLLEQQQLPYVALDLDAVHINKARLAGDNVTYGNACHYEMLFAVGIEHAKALVICIDDTATILKILSTVRRHQRQIPILVRSYDDSDLDTLFSAGATEVIPETLESGLVLGSHLLLHMGAPVLEVYHAIETTRRRRYDLFDKVFPGTPFLEQEHLPGKNKHLDTFTLPEHAKATQVSLDSLPFQALEVELIHIHRQGRLMPIDDKLTQLQAGDVLLLFGTSEQLSQLKRALVR